MKSAINSRPNKRLSGKLFESLLGTWGKSIASDNISSAGANSASYRILGRAASRDAAAMVSFEESERCFDEHLLEPLKQAEAIGDADIMVGIPFYNEVETLRSTLEIMQKGLQEFYPNKKSVIVAAGSPVGQAALDTLLDFSPANNSYLINFLLGDDCINGKGWAIRALLEIGRVLGADLVIVEADLRNQLQHGQIEGINPEWVPFLLEPIRREGMDLVVPYFKRHYLESAISSHLLYPLMTSICRCPVHDFLGGQWGISNKMVRTYTQDIRLAWDADISRYGVESWLISKAIASRARICESNLGIKICKPSAGKSELVLRQVISALFNQIIINESSWGRDEENARVPLLQPLANYGAGNASQPLSVKVTPGDLTSKYVSGFNRFYPLYKKITPKAIYQQLEELASAPGKDFKFLPALWAQVVYCFILACRFNKEYDRNDLAKAFVPLFEGYLASFALEMQALKAKLEPFLPEEAERLVSAQAEKRIEELINEFLCIRPDFLTVWQSGELATQPPVPKVTYREFIPGVPLVVPQELPDPEGNLVDANGIYEPIFECYKNEFNQFIYEKLKVPARASSLEISQCIMNFMHQLERQLDEVLLPGDLQTVAGTQQVIEALFRIFPLGQAFSLKPDLASWLLGRYPPHSLLTRLGYNSVAQLLARYEPNEALAMAGWSEAQEYVEQLHAVVREHVRPEHFELCVLKPLIVSHETFPSLAEMKECSAFCKIAGVIMVSNLPKGMGGEFPKLRYVTTIAKSIVEAERFGQVWQRFAKEGKEFGTKVINSIQGHWGREPLSAHSIFENGHQRVLVERVREMAQNIAREADGDSPLEILAEYLNNMAAAYHLALALPDGTFVPCSAWTWASHSFKGGRGVPTPVSVHIERDWSSADFLTSYFTAIGGTENTISERIEELMGQGREWENLAPILLGEVKEAEEIVPRQSATLQLPQAGILTRPVDKPLIEPIKEHPWESKYVLNPGAIKLNSRVYIIYRAVGEEDISRLGLAISEDGYNFKERLERPIFEPGNRSEERGCEDPRITLLGDRIFMVYTAYNGMVAQIALASISINDFLNYKWEGWQRHGLVFPWLTDKDGALFPEQVKGKFAMLHRVDPHMWISFSNHLNCPWPKKGHRILAGSTSGLMWDGRKIGGGTQPLKTKYGWLLITHGVDYAYVYRLGVMLLDLADPTVLLFRSPNPVLEPLANYEKGEKGSSWVPNVVFTCGAVPVVNSNKVLEAEDEVLVYYGAADSAIGVATGKIGDLIPEEVRQGK